MYVAILYFTTTLTLLLADALLAPALTKQNTSVALASFLPEALCEPLTFRSLSALVSLRDTLPSVEFLAPKYVAAT